MQIAHLLRKNYKWLNLNPFGVLELPLEATPEDIRQRYR
jgi:hypothetical protein